MRHTEPAPTGETDLTTILNSLTVGRRPGEYHVVTISGAEAEGLRIGSGIEALIREPEAFGETVTVVCDADTIEHHGWSSAFAAAWLTIEVQTSLEAVGLMAVLANTLAAAGIPCNVLAGFHHDHILVPVAQADRAVACLESIGGRAGG